ncbi:hypothetical protein [uncultured Bacteroides sp.]|nr:hypothetical protein [uncultured Bacteroides sp.]
MKQNPSAGAFLLASRARQVSETCIAPVYPSCLAWAAMPQGNRY